MRKATLVVHLEQTTGRIPPETLLVQLKPLTAIFT